MLRNPNFQPALPWKGESQKQELSSGWAGSSGHSSMTTGALLPLLLCSTGLTSEGPAVSSSKFCSHRHSAVTCSSLTAVRGTSDFHAPLRLELSDCLGVGKLSSENIGCGALPCWLGQGAQHARLHMLASEEEMQAFTSALEGAVPTNLKCHLLVPFPTVLYTVLCFLPSSSMPPGGLGDCALLPGGPLQSPWGIE